MPLKYLQIVFAVLLLVLGAAISNAWPRSTVKPVELHAEIVGPATVDQAGRVAFYHVTVPGKSPTDLIYTWSVVAIGSDATTEIEPTSNPGEALLGTVAGRWRLSCAIADPVTRKGQVLTREIVIPSSPISPKPLPPEPSPAPLPAPSPQPVPPGPGPTPAPQPQPPAPANRFSDLSDNVRTWLVDVQSPAKVDESKALRAGCLAIVERLRTGDLSKLSGYELKAQVLLVVRASNDAAVKANPSAWRGFDSRVATYAGTANGAGQLVTAADWADFLQAFADGLSR